MNIQKICICTMFTLNIQALQSASFQPTSYHHIHQHSPVNPCVKLDILLMLSTQSLMTVHDASCTDLVNNHISLT